MGLKLGFSKCDHEVHYYEKRYEAPTPEQMILPNPDPSNFEILRSYYDGWHVLLLVKYPDCENYEGNKILLFTDVSLRTVMAMKSMDPHFCEGGHLSPFARFEPTESGWQAGLLLMEGLNG